MYREGRYLIVLASGILSLMGMLMLSSCRTVSSLPIVPPLSRNDSLLAVARVDMEEDLPDRAIAALAQMDEGDSLRAERLYLLAQAYRQKHDLDASMRYTQKALSVSQDSVETASLIRFASDLCYDMGDYERALSFALSLRGEERRLGRIYMARREAEKAIGIYEGMLLEIPSEDSFGRAHILEMLSRAEDMQALSSRSILHLKESLEMYKRLGGEETETVSDLYYSLGQKYFQKAQMLSALECFSKCREIYTAIYGEDDVNVADACVAIATAYEAMASYESSRECYLKAMEIFSSCFGEDSRQVSLCCFLLGRMSFASEKFSEALDWHSKALSMRMMAEPQNEKETESSLFCVGASYLSLGNMGEAHEYLLKALEMSKRIYGDSHEETVMIRSWMERIR